MCTGRFISWVLLTATILGAGCGTLKDGQKWGEEAFSSSTLERIPWAAYRALTDWRTLIPAAGGLVLKINDYDSKISTWAINHRPIFGSESRARETSDYIYTALYLEAAATALATPSGENRQDWVESKAKGLALESAAMLLTAGTTLAIREATRRTNPIDTNDASSPSGHATLGFGAIALSHRNLDSILMPTWARVAIKTTDVVLGTTMAWGRIEGGEHFPTDVLFGAALGNFLCLFIYDAFMGIPEKSGLGLSVVPQRKGLGAAVSFNF